eukprot:CAMPEP_0116872584 /NCGR_PEP_ID=MMETSP0463-20121206/3363_1 /TAXON_ID=181622 /ORGANISM="Strombidinopsis sp, Strain SopsisLIS2011" /LENGTH=86 /DNA_ID=CAMNT_0004513009 /DNA_START=1256 /DNA_END=1516 /DNA_ORIENTATION=-
MEEESPSLDLYLKRRSFNRRDCELNSSFKPDKLDQIWYAEQKNKHFLSRSNYWCVDLYKESIKIYKEAITESGMGQSCYTVINDYL